MKNPFSLLFEWQQRKLREKAINHVQSNKIIKAKIPKHPFPKDDRTLIVSELLK
jgi:hypothetical protein